MSIRVMAVHVTLGSHEVLCGTTFEVEPGEFVALIAPSGAGKTTVLNVCCGFVKPQRGTVRIGPDGTTGAPIAIVPQGGNSLPHRTVFDNVAIAARSRGLPEASVTVEVDDALARLALTQNADQRAGELSGGQLTRLAFARAIATRRQYIVADEPTAHLDARSTATVIDRLRELCDTGVALLVATHDPVLTRHTDRTLSLVNGKIEALQP